MGYSDMMDDNQLLDHIRCNLIDVETEQQKTNELLGQILEELRSLNKSLTPVPLSPAVIAYDSIPTGKIFAFQPNDYLRCGGCGAIFPKTETHSCTRGDWK